MKFLESTAFWNPTKHTDFEHPSQEKGWRVKPTPFFLPCSLSWSDQCVIKTPVNKTQHSTFQERDKDQLRLKSKTQYRQPRY